LKREPANRQSYTMENTFRFILIAFIAAILAVRVYYYIKAGARREVRTRTQEQRRLGMLRMITGLPGCAALALWMVNPAHANWAIMDLPEWLRLSGAALAPLALILLVWVHRTLDTNFSPTLRLKVSHRLVMHGPYRWVRHPMYTALMLVGIAVVLISANWPVALITIPGMTLAVALRIPHEETMMIERFGDQYLTYIHRTGLVLPRLTLLRRDSFIHSAQ
jgi:protein-S-isoprenylcysteine O-methyltransferase Ste14